MKSFSRPTNSQVDAAIPLLSSPQHEAYFFSQLQNPNWIEPLKERNLFATPPGPEIIEGEGTRHPRWPASAYLARMATIAPAIAIDVLSSIETDNASIIGDMLDAALSAPPTAAKPLVQKISKAVAAGTIWFGFEKVGELCVALASAGDTESAMVLVDSMLSIDLLSSDGCRVGNAGYHYLEVLEKIAPTLTAAAARQFCTRLINALDDAIGHRDYTDATTGEDYSSIWRPAIEARQEYDGRELSGRLVDIVVGSIENAVDAGGMTLAESSARLEEHRYSAFKRLQIYLVNRFAERDPDLAVRSMLDRALFDSPGYKHEYSRLVGARWQLLAEEQRREWLGWVDEGPRWRTGPNADLDPAELERAEWWRYERLYWIRDHLLDTHRDRYDQMRARHGEPTFADTSVRMSIGWGYDTPVDAEDLNELPFTDVIRKLTSIDSDPSRRGRVDVEGLAHVFGQYLTGRAAACSQDALVLKGVSPAYIATFLSSTRMAIIANELVAVDPVLELCNWVVGQDAFGAWQTARNETAAVISSICNAASNDAPRFSATRYRTALWGLLRRLVGDMAESGISRNPDADPRVHDYLLYGINSPRGHAVEGILNYARWVAHQDEHERGSDHYSRGFGAMPEVAELLEQQLAPGHRTFEALAIIGSRMGLLHWLDREWIELKARRLFDLAEYDTTPMSACGWAAWNAFLVWVNPHLEFYRIFNPEFEYAVEQSLKVEGLDRSNEQPMFRLAEHLVVLYARGQISIDPGSLLYSVVTRANADIRRRVITYIGFSIQRAADVDGDIVNRLMLLWDVYWPACGREDAAKEPRDYLFGQWFQSGVFPSAWALMQLEQFVAVVPIPSPDHEVIPQLAKICDVDLVRSIKILSAIVDGDKEGWRIYGWRDAAAAIIDRAMKKGGEAREISSRLIDRLGRRGFLEFGQLLTSSPDVGPNKEPRNPS